MRASAAFRRQDQTIALTLQLPLCQFADNCWEVALPSSLSCRRFQHKTLLPLRRTSTALHEPFEILPLAQSCTVLPACLVISSRATVRGYASARMSQDSMLPVVVGMRQSWRAKTRSDAVSRPWHSSLSSADPKWSSSFPPPLSATRDCQSCCRHAQYF
jgi:hypothetical protein